MPEEDFHLSNQVHFQAHRVRPLARTFTIQDDSASEAAEGCISQHKRCPQEPKPVLCHVVNVRAEARS